MNKQVTISNQIVETRDRRFSKGMVVAVSCEIVAIDSEKGTYKVQSETDTNKYYIVKFMDGTPVYCSCPDFLNRIKTNPFHICKHARAIVLAENYGLITTTTKQPSYDITKLTTKQDVSYSITRIQEKQHPSYSITSIPKQGPKSYRDDDYSV